MYFATRRTLTRSGQILKEITQRRDEARHELSGATGAIEDREIHPTSLAVLEQKNSANYDSLVAEVLGSIDIQVIEDQFDIAKEHIVQIGSEVVLEIKGAGRPNPRTATYQILGPVEAAPDAGTVICSTNVLARAIIDHCVGDVVAYNGGNTAKIISTKRWSGLEKPVRRRKPRHEAKAS
ncbi:MAG: GreA/GreB family elongation factor [Patescibacteria group bacterium]